MKKLILGIVDFRHKTLPSFRETFARLALGHQPDVLFASTEPVDLFVIRNVGNRIPPCGAMKKLRTAEVYWYDEEQDRFIPIDDEVAERLLERLG